MKLEEIINHSHAEIYEFLSEPDPFSAFEDYEDFKLLLIRRVEFDEDRLFFKSEAFLLKEDEVYYCNRDRLDFIKLAGGAQELSTTLDKYYTNNQKIISGFSVQVEHLEDFLFGRSLPSVFMDIWFGIKRELSKLENYYHRNGIVYREFLRKSESHFGDFSDDFKDIEDEIRFQSSNIDSLNARLDNIHHHYDSIKSDRLNKTLLMLTIISGIFLPLNLIVGFFGMNTPGLFFMEHPNGTTEVLFLLAGVLFVSLLGIPTINIVDKYILRLILGRYKFYKQFSSRIDEFNERLKGK